MALPILNAKIQNVPGGSELVLQFNGTPGSNYVLQVATNLTSPINWQIIITNVAEVNGNWSFSVTNSALFPARFYRLTIP